jgi:hypothetical protein
VYEGKIVSKKVSTGTFFATLLLIGKNVVFDGTPPRASHINHNLAVPYIFLSLYLKTIRKAIANKEFCAFLLLFKWLYAIITICSHFKEV